MKKEILRLLKKHLVIIESNIYLFGPVKLPIDINGSIVQFSWYTWINSSKLPKNIEKLIEDLPLFDLNKLHTSSILMYGDFQNNNNAFVRLHSICHTGDIFGSKKCDCGYQFKQALKLIVDNGCGALFYLANQEGRGIGLFNKSMTYLLQENGYDTVEANLQLGFQDDARCYQDVAKIIKYFRKKPINLITNNPSKIKELMVNGVLISKQTLLWEKPNIHNEYYLKTKINKSGHILHETPIMVGGQK